MRTGWIALAALAAFPAHAQDRIIFDVRTAGEICAAIQLNRGIRADHDAAREINARGNSNRPAAGSRAGIESFLQRGGVFGFSVTGRAKVTDVEEIRRAFGKGGKAAENQRDAEENFSHHWTRRMLGQQNTCQLSLQAFSRDKPGVLRSSRAVRKPARNVQAAERRRSAFLSARSCF